MLLINVPNSKLTFVFFSFLLIFTSLSNVLRLSVSKKIFPGCFFYKAKQDARLWRTLPKGCINKFSLRSVSDLGFLDARWPQLLLFHLFGRLGGPPPDLIFPAWKKGGGDENWWFHITQLSEIKAGLLISQFPLLPTHPPNPTHLLPHSHCTAMHFTQHFLGVWQAAFAEIHEQWSGSATLVGRRAAISQCQIDHFDQCLISPTYLPCIIISLCVTTKNPLPMWKIQIHVCNFLYFSTFPLWQ